MEPFKARWRRDIEGSAFDKEESGAISVVARQQLLRAMRLHRGEVEERDS